MGKEQIHEVIYFISGMHCSSCELLIEKNVAETFSRVKVVDVSLAKGHIVLEGYGDMPNTQTLNDLFHEQGYTFSTVKKQGQTSIDYTNTILLIFFILFFGLIGFALFGRYDVMSYMQVSATSSLFAFFALGLIAGISSCGALVGGMIISLSHQWALSYQTHHTFIQKLSPHFSFITGRIVSYTLFGVLLGYIGELLRLSISVYALISIVIALIMILLGLQMTGFSYLRKFQITLPKSWLRYIAKQETKQQYVGAFLLGALTFFLPCGFTLTVQGIALIAASPIYGGLILGVFALGTSLPLIAIAGSCVKCLEKPHISGIFSKVAGFLIMVFGVYTLFSQLTVLGVNPFLSFSRNASFTDAQLIMQDQRNVQVMKMDATAFGYTPGYFRIKKGIPVIWEITDKGASGCTNVIIAPQLFSDQVTLTQGTVTQKEFLPIQEGIYSFSCWMGMAKGMIEVVN